MSAERSFPRWVLAFFLFGLAFSITLAEAALAVLAGHWLLRLRTPAARAPGSFPLIWPVLAFGAATLLAALRSGVPAASLADAKSFLLVLILYVLLEALGSASAADRLLSRLFLLLAIAAGLGILQVTLCPRDPWGIPLLSRFFRRCDRAHSFYSIYMTLAGVLTLILLATLPRLLAGPRDRRSWTLPLWVTCGLGLVLTYTRGAWLGFLAGAASLAILLRRLLVLGAIGVGLAMFLVLFPSGTLGDRIRSLGDPSDPTLRERLYMWQSGLQMVRDRPLTGVGPGRLQAHYPRYVSAEAGRKATSHLHNTPLQILVERGLLGLAAWLWLWAAFFLRGARLLRRIGPGQDLERGLVAGSLAAIGGFLVSGLFEYNFGDSEVVMVAYLLMALPFVVERSVSSSGEARWPAEPSGRTP